MTHSVDYSFFALLDHYGLHDGVLMDEPDACRSCTIHSCQTLKISADEESAVCEFGIPFLRLKKNIIAIGLKLNSQITSVDFEPSSGVLLIHPELFQTLASFVNLTTNETSVYASEQLKNHNSIDLLPFPPTSPERKKAIIQAGQLQKASQNLAHTVASRVDPTALPDAILTADRLAEHSWFWQRAYWGTRYQLGKIKLLQLSLAPESLLKTYNCIPFQLTGIITRLIELFRNRFRQSGVQIEFNSGCGKLSMASPDAIRILFYALLDNAVRYAPPSGKIRLTLSPTTSGQTMELESLGPQITHYDRPRLFQAGYRGKAVRNDHSGRVGIGLFLASLIAENHLGITLNLSQQEAAENHFYPTRITMTIPDEAKIISHNHSPF